MGAAGVCEANTVTPEEVHATAVAIVEAFGGRPATPRTIMAITGLSPWMVNSRLRSLLEPAGCVERRGRSMYAPTGRPVPDAASIGKARTLGRAAKIRAAMNAKFHGTVSAAVLAELMTGPKTVAEIARRLGKSPDGVRCVLVRQLTRRGLVERHGAHWCEAGKWNGPPQPTREELLAIANADRKAREAREAERRARRLAQAEARAQAKAARAEAKRQRQRARAAAAAARPAREKQPPEYVPSPATIRAQRLKIQAKNMARHEAKRRPRREYEPPDDDGMTAAQRACRALRREWRQLRRAAS